MTGPLTPASRALAGDFAAIGDRLVASSDSDAALTEMSVLARSAVPFCDEAAITVRAGRRKFATLAGTDPRARAADELQCQLRLGPCIDATGSTASTGSVFVTGEPYGDSRSQSSKRVLSGIPFRSVLSVTVYPAPTPAALTCYSLDAPSFPADAVAAATAFAAHAQLLLCLIRQTSKIGHLHRALDSSRTIGYAVGITMHAYRLTADQAFQYLVRTSQSHNSPLIDVATHIVDTGAVPSQATRARDPHPKSLTGEQPPDPEPVPVDGIGSADPRPIPPPGLDPAGDQVGGDLIDTDPRREGSTT